MEKSAEERREAARIAAHESWARTEDRTARTANSRAAFWARLLDQAGGDPVRAENLRQAHFARLRHKSLRARRQAKEVRLLIEAAEAEEELQKLGGEAEVT
jgi:hypothetical protein